MTEVTTGLVQADTVDEARRLLVAAERQQLPLRAIGGAAVAIRAASRLHPAFRREIGDIDLVTTKSAGGEVSEFLAVNGYEPDRGFNALHGARRLLFHELVHGRKVDVFVGSFELCHALPVGERLMLEPMTVPLAELLMTKLQIVELNAKDRGDIYALLLAHDVGDHDGETISAPRIATLCAGNWGLYRTFQLNMVRLHEGLKEIALTEEQRNQIADRLDRLVTAMEQVPKSLKWRIRARVGDRVRWYEAPEEVEGD